MNCGYPTPDGPCQRERDTDASLCDRHRDTTLEQRIAAAKEMAEAAHSAKRTASLRPPPTEPEALLTDDQLAAIGSALIAHGVLFAIIGGAALNLHRAPVERTRDVDILVDRDPANLAKLAAALNALQARLWVGVAEPEGIATTWTPELLSAHQMFVNLLTSSGPLDVTYFPSGLEGGYQSIADSIVIIGVRDIQLPVASIGTIVASKTAAGRPKDVIAITKIRRWLNNQRDHK
jgi:hypothetical protein